MSRVNLSQITSLNFEADEYTTGRRLAPVAQLQCDKKEGRSACEQYTPESIHCENRGWDAYTHAVQWSCSTTLPSNLKLGKVRVNCERWEESGPANEVLNGSCALKYTLVDVSNRSDDKGSTFFAVIFFAILAIILYNLFCGHRKDSAGYSTSGDQPPPPYTPYNSKQPDQQAGQNWRPGFWTGLGVGGAGAHLYDQWQNRDSHSHSEDSFGRHHGSSSAGPSNTYESTTSYGGTDTR
ncbi:hypothetical protein E3P78_02562 [Wallemia ichthyophaga]|nr:hypothetical protein E3P78_02562 [Wallemia ichthyophaga]